MSETTVSIEEMARLLKDKKIDEVIKESCKGYFYSVKGEAKKDFLASALQLTEGERVELRGLHRQVIAALDDLKSSIEDYRKLKKSVEGEFTSEKEKNAYLFYKLILETNLESGASGDQAVKSASYALYGFYGGQRIEKYKKEDSDNSKFVYSFYSTEDNNDSIFG